MAPWRASPIERLETKVSRESRYPEHLGKPWKLETMLDATHWWIGSLDAWIDKPPIKAMDPGGR